MKLKVQRVFEATPVVAQIINANRPVTQRGRFLIARMHAKLLPEWQTISAQRDSLITAYDHRGEDGNFSVPPDKAEEFFAAWSPLGSEEIDVPVDPIPVDCLSVDGAETVSYQEFVMLGELVTE